MDVKNLIGGVNLDVVRSSPTKKATIVSGGLMREVEPGKVRLTLAVDLDGTIQQYTLNKTSIRNIALKHGTETLSWVGKSINLEIGTVNGRECVISKPI